MPSTVTHITPMLIKEFRDKKILSHSEECIPVELDPIQEGEAILTTLTADESVIFVELFNLQEDMEMWDRELAHRGLTKAAADIIADADSKFSSGIMIDSGALLSEAESEEYNETLARYTYLEAFFWYNIRRRTTTFNHTIGVRRGFVLVSTGRKFATK